jgi:hypothetical protein
LLRLVAAVSKCPQERHANPKTKQAKSGKEGPEGVDLTKAGLDVAHGPLLQQADSAGQLDQGWKVVSLKKAAELAYSLRSLPCEPAD